MTARGALAGLALAALGALGSSGAASDDRKPLGAFEACSVGLVGSLEAIASEFPGFRAGEVRLEAATAGMWLETMRSVDPAKLRELGWDDVPVMLRFMRNACAAADDVADVLRELRDGRSEYAGVLWRMWSPYDRPSGWMG